MGRCEGGADLVVSLTVFPLILLSGQANPYGPEMPEAWLKIMAMPLPDLIQEHRPLSLWRPEGWMVAALAAVYGLLLWDALRSREDKPLAHRVVVWFLPLVWLVFAVQRSAARAAVCHRGGHRDCRSVAVYALRSLAGEVGAVFVPG